MFITTVARLVYVVVQLDALSVTMALPRIQTDLNVEPGAAQWVLLGFTLPAVALGLPDGRYLDRIGRRAALVLSVTGFAVAAAAAGLAPSLGWLIAARVVQGGFGALLTVAVLAVMLALSFTAEGRFAWLSLALLAIPPALAWYRTGSGRLMGRLLRVSGVRAPMLALWTQIAGQLTVPFRVPFYLARQLDAGSATAGLVLRALPAGRVLFSPIAGRLADAWGTAAPPSSA